MNSMTIKTCGSSDFSDGFNTNTLKDIEPVNLESFLLKHKNLINELKDKTQSRRNSLKRFFI